jgi:hypothetical protein
VTGLKVVVVALAVFLVAGFGVLFLRMAEHRRAAADPASALLGTPGPVAKEATVALPSGARVVQVAPAGPLVDVLVERPDGTWELLQVRRADGSVAGTLRLAPAAP